MASLAFTNLTAQSIEKSIQPGTVSGADETLRSIQTLDTGSETDYDDIVDIREELEEQLSKKNSPGSFAFWADDLPSINPGLKAHDIGLIALPIYEAEAQRIIQSATKAPYGKGSETIVDESVRKTWEIDGRKIATQNPKWTQWLDVVLDRVKRGLGLKAETIRAELYKLLLYGEGAHFKPHRDTEKTSGMFGTLVICLPSPHEGGDLRVIHDGNEKIFSTSSNSAFEMSCAAWYSDVLHEVKPVVNGYRVVLTYNLVLGDSSFRPSAGSLEDETMLSRLLHRYVIDVDSVDSLPNQWIHRLKHKYTQASLQVERLKRSDQTVLKRLQAAANNKCEIYLALLEREISGSCEDDGYNHSHRRGGWSDYSEDDEDDYSTDESADPGMDTNKRYNGVEHDIIDLLDEFTVLKHVTALDGTCVVAELPVGEDSFIQDIYNESRVPDEEDFSGYTGNEGTSVTHWYHDAVLVIVPKKSAYTFRLGQYLENQRLVPAMVETLIGSLDHGDPAAKGDLEKICQFCFLAEEVRRRRGTHLSYSLNSKLMESATEKSLARACAALQTPELLRRAADLLDADDLVECFKLMGNRFKASEPDRIACLQGIKTAVMKLSSPAQRFAALDGLNTAYSATQSDDASIVYDFVRDAMDIVVDAFGDEKGTESSERMISHKDGLAILAVLSKYNRLDLEPRILKQAHRVTLKTGAAVGLLLGLLEAYYEKRLFDNDRLRTVFLPLYDHAIQNFSLKEAIQRIREVPNWTSGYMSTYMSTYMSKERECRSRDIDFNSNLARQLARLYGRCLQTEGIPETRLLDAITASTEEDWSVTEFECLTVPFLQELLKVMQRNSVQYDEHDGRYQHLFQRAVQSHLRRHVGAAPSPPRDWSRQQVVCSCDDCRILNAFLKDPRQRAGRFPMAEKRRKHLSYELSRTNQRHDEHTVRDKPPFTLVVTKNKKSYEWDYGLWRSRARDAETALRRIDLNALRVLLGPQYFHGQSLHLTDSTTSQVSSMARSPLAATNANARATKRRLEDEQVGSPPAKRKHAEVVDLTSL